MLKKAAHPVSMESVVPGRREQSRRPRRTRRLRRALQMGSPLTRALDTGADVYYARPRRPTLESVL